MEDNEEIKSTKSLKQHGTGSPNVNAGSAAASRKSLQINEDVQSRKIRVESHILIPREMSVVLPDQGKDDDDDDHFKDTPAPLEDETNITDIVSMLEEYYEASIESVEEEEEELKEEVEEESSLSEESEPIDRDEYIEHYKHLAIQFMPVKAKNLFLQRKMAEYFKRRKMDHVLRETDQIAENLAKYNKKLDLFYDLHESDSTKRNRITEQISTLRTKRTEQFEQVMRDFKAIQKREKEIGTGLIYTKTGRQIPEKFLERILWHQVNKTEEITKMRLKFIRLRDAVAEKQQQIRDMDKIGEHHTLIDFEQLKMENQGHADKIEERDEELARLRVACSSAIECLAHIREKCVANGQSIAESKIFLSSVSEQLFAAREKVNKTKLQRDTLRAESRKLKQQSGLLTKPKLLRDMEDAVQEVNVYLQELADMKAKHEVGKRRLWILKKNVGIAKREETRPAKPAEKLDELKLYKGRPSLMIPILPKAKSINYINI